MFVAPGRAKLVLEHNWSFLLTCVCLGMGSGSRGPGWNMWVVVERNLRISSTKRTLIQASFHFIFQRICSGKGVSLVLAHRRYEVSHPSRTLCPLAPDPPLSALSPDGEKRNSLPQIPML